MNTQEKLDATKDAVLITWEDTKNQDACCAACIGIEGVAFGDIAALVKQHLVDSGFLVPLQKRKDELENELNTGYDFTEILEFDEYTELIDELSSTHDITKTWVKNKLNAAIKDQGYEIPKKVKKTGGWKAQIIKCFANNPDITQEELAQCILDSGTVKAETNARYYAKQFHQFCAELISATIQE